jgi:glycosyltransferase involved in cell wall biosynthesis
MYSTLILAKNEHENIVRCLDSLQACDDVVVLDSGSTDGTQDAASARGARVFTRDFDTFADQRNWAIDNVSFKHEWVLHLDADECLTPSLPAELLQVTGADAKSAYFLANKLIFLGSWIRRSSLYPYYQARLLRLGESRFEQIGHGQHLAFATRGSGRLREPYLHHNFSKGIADWVERHNRYSSDEARRVGDSQQSMCALVANMLPGKSTETRQQAKKLLADRMPFRPFVRFLYAYIWRGGFLDGRAGFHYCMLMAFYDYLTRLKRQELAASPTHHDSRPTPVASGSLADAE